MISNAVVALLCLLSWTLGALYGGYRYERLWLDRSVADIWRDMRGERSEQSGR